MRALTAFSRTKAGLGLLGGALAAGGVALVVAFSAGSAIDPVAAQDVTYFRIGAGTPGSAYYGIASQIAGIVSNPPGSRECDGEGACGVEGLLGLAQTTANPVDSIESLRGQSLEAAIVSADIADAALQGTGPFKKAGPMVDLRAIVNVGEVVLHIVVAKESKAAGIKDLAGKKIAIGVADSENALTAKALLRAAGLPEKKIKAIDSETATAAAGLLTGEIDALVLVDEMPSTEIGALMASGNYRLLGAQLAGEDNPKYLFEEWIPAGKYPGVDSTRAIAVPSVLVARADLPGQIADGLVRALWHSAMPDASETAAGSIMPEMSRASVPWHPNAAAAFTELAKTAPALPETDAPTN